MLEQFQCAKILMNLYQILFGQETHEITVRYSHLHLVG